MFRKLFNDQHGAAVAEYALLLGLIAVVAIGGMSYIGDQVQLKLGQVGACIASPSGQQCQ